MVLQGMFKVLSLLPDCDGPMDASSLSIESRESLAIPNARSPPTFVFDDSIKTSSALSHTADNTCPVSGTLVAPYLVYTGMFCDISTMLVPAVTEDILILPATSTVDVSPVASVPAVPIVQAKVTDACSAWPLSTSGPFTTFATDGMRSIDSPSYDPPIPLVSVKQLLLPNAAVTRPSSQLGELQDRFRGIVIGPYRGFIGLFGFVNTTSEAPVPLQPRKEEPVACTMSESQLELTALSNRRDSGRRELQAERQDLVKMHKQRERQLQQEEINIMERAESRRRKMGLQRRERRRAERQAAQTRREIAKDIWVQGTWRLYLATRNGKNDLVLYQPPVFESSPCATCSSALSSKEHLIILVLSAIVALEWLLGRINQHRSDHAKRAEAFSLFIAETTSQDSLVPSAPPEDSRIPGRYIKVKLPSGPDAARDAIRKQRLNHTYETARYPPDMVVREDEMDEMLQGDTFVLEAGKAKEDDVVHEGVFLDTDEIVSEHETEDATIAPVVQAIDGVNHLVVTTDDQPQRRRHQRGKKGKGRQYPTTEMPYPYERWNENHSGMVVTIWPRWMLELFNPFPQRLLDLSEHATGEGMRQSLFGRASEGKKQKKQRVRKRRGNKRSSPDAEPPTERRSGSAAYPTPSEQAETMVSTLPQDIALPAPDAEEAKALACAKDPTATTPTNASEPQDVALPTPDAEEAATLALSEGYPAIAVLENDNAAALVSTSSSVARQAPIPRQAAKGSRALENSRWSSKS